MEKLVKNLFFLIFLAIFTTSSILSWYLCSYHNKSKLAENNEYHNGSGRISGTIILNGVKTNPEELENIEFYIREYNTDAFFEKTNVVIEPSLKNKGMWMIDGVEENKIYEVQAKLIMNGQKITQSQIAILTAPASNIELTLTITWEGIPESDRNKSQDQNISGEVNTSGFIPDGSTYTIFIAPMYERSESRSDDILDTKFEKLLTETISSQNNMWEWHEALPKKNYLLRAEIHTGQGDYIGSSEVIDVTMPQNSIILNVESRANTEPIQKSLYGTITLNGTYANDSMIKIQVHEDNQSGFYDVDSFPAENTRKWVYPHAKSGVNYNVRAILERNGTEQARSIIKHVVVPSDDITLVVDSRLTLEDLKSRPEIVYCDKKADENTYDAKIHFPSMLDAHSYWIKIGKEKHIGDLFNEIEKPQNYGDDMTLTMRVEKDKYYYAEYAYSYCNDCKSLDYYSNFSQSLKFYCGNEPIVK